MADAIDPNNADRLLTAFADGELDAAQGLAVLRHVTRDPAAAAKVEGQLQFRQAVGRAMRQVPAPSAGLRESLSWLKVETIESSASAVAAPARAPGASTREATRSRWFIGPALPLAAAASVAFLLIGVWAGHAFFNKPTTPIAVGPNPLPTPGPTPAPTPATPVPVAYIANALRVHVDCSRYPQLHKGTWPTALNDLGPPLIKYFGKNVYPDLTPLGYEYMGSGPCDQPLANAAHELYRSTKPGSNETLSLFVQKDDKHTVDVEEGKVYRGVQPGAPPGTPAAHPMIIWRHGIMVFYLVGDAEQSVRDAAGAMKISVPL